MKLKVERFKFLEHCTIGRLLIDGVFSGIYTLEDTVRPAGVKIPGQTAIPTGTYKVIVNMSARFKKLMPLLLDVQNYTGVRIHSGNKDGDTEGCLLVGLEWNGGDFIGKSRDAFNILLPKIQAALSLGSVEIEIA